MGDGPKYAILKKSIEKNNLSEKVILFGALPNEKVLELLEESDIFLNTAITESFGIALVEAASLGLHCVSTNVGGIPEILPKSSLTVVNPDIDELKDALNIEINKLK